jgi:hypothetical protein
MREGPGVRLMTEQQDLFGAKQARDDALSRVSGNTGTWMHKALVAVSDLKSGVDLTGEDIRLRVADRVGNPHHHNAWGALIKAAIKNDLITPTGKYRAMQTVKSHARRTPVYYIR